MKSFFSIPFWGRGFRPFFLMGALYAAGAIPLWIGIRHGVPTGITDPLFWHAHEMIFGFTGAIMAGFLLTAVANWTGGAPARSYRLAILAGLWLTGRIGWLLPGLWPAVRIAMEAPFLPALALSLGLALWQSRNFRNLLFIGLLMALWVCDMASMATGDVVWLHTAVLVVMILISTIGGRIVPAFTVAALRRAGRQAFQNSQPVTDTLALGLAIATAVTYPLVPDAPFITGSCAIMAGLVNALRLYRAHFLRCFFDSMVWVLHIGFVWMIVGFLAWGGAMFGWIPLSIALHALTTGAIGTLCIGMMCRVALGHTGRAIKAGRATVLAFFLIQVSALARVFGVLLSADHPDLAILVSGSAWALAFTIYAVAYGPVLVAARPDGEEA